MNDFKDLHARLVETVEDMTQPRWVTDFAGEALEVIPLVEAVSTTLSGVRTATPSATAWRTKPPLWIPALDWSLEVRRVCHEAARALGVASDMPGGENNPELVTEILHTTAYAMPWAPEHADTLRGVLGSLVALRSQGTKLAYPAMFTVSGACPKCGVEKCVSDGVEHPALAVYPWWAECAGCGARWEEGEVVRLAEQVRGIEPW